MPDGGDYHAFNSTSGGSGSSGSGGGGGGGFGCATWVVIGIVAFFLISFIADGASWDAIDTLLGFGLLLFLFVRANGG